MQELNMDIKCSINPYYFNKYQSPTKSIGTVFRGVQKIPLDVVEKSADMFIKKPVELESTAGLLGLKPIDKVRKTQTVFSRIKNYAKNYVKNIKHTYEHKIVFALIEKELFGKNSIDSITHDADKMILYILGFPKSFVSSFHRKHSSHHPESGKKMNLRSMLCDNIASSPEFKPEKKLSLREHYRTSKLLQSVSGLYSILERYNYGEDLDFQKIKRNKDIASKEIKGLVYASGILSLLNFL